MDKIYEALRDSEDAVLTGFVTISEWMDAEGNRYLRLFNSEQPIWQQEGLLMHALNAEWDEDGYEA